MYIRSSPFHTRSLTVIRTRHEFPLPLFFRSPRISLSYHSNFFFPNRPRDTDRIGRGTSGRFHRDLWSFEASIDGLWKPHTAQIIPPAQHNFLKDVLKMSRGCSREHPANVLRILLGEPCCRQQYCNNIANLLAISLFALFEIANPKFLHLKEINIYSDVEERKGEDAEYKPIVAASFCAAWEATRVFPTGVRSLINYLLCDWETGSTLESPDGESPSCSHRRSYRNAISRRVRQHAHAFEYTDCEQNVHYTRVNYIAAPPS